MVAPYPKVNEEIVDSPENQTMKSDDGTGKLIDGDRKLGDKNVPGQSGGKYTQNYITGNKNMTG